MVPHQKDAVMKSHISQWESSSLTQIAYCKQHGIKPHIFSYYKAKFSRGDKGSAAVANGLVPVGIISSNTSLTKLAMDSDLIKNYRIVMVLA